MRLLRSLPPAPITRSRQGTQGHINESGRVVSWTKAVVASRSGLFSTGFLPLTLSHTGITVCFRNVICFPHHLSFKLRMRVCFLKKEENYTPFLILPPQTKWINKIVRKISVQEQKANASFWSARLTHWTENSKECSWGLVAVTAFPLGTRVVFKSTKIISPLPL